MSEAIEQFKEGIVDAAIGIVGGILLAILFLLLNTTHTGLFFYLAVIIFFIADTLAALFKAVFTGTIYALGLFIGGLFVKDPITILFASIGLCVNIYFYFDN
jgi:hypothetical protein